MGRPRYGVSIHAPAGGATSRGHRQCCNKTFQFTLPRGERPINSLRQAFQLQFQFTLPRGERQGVQRKWTRRTRVSIHAPAGGATISTGLLSPTSVFQFTLPRGERPRPTRLLVTASKFQFTLPRGERLVNWLLRLVLNLFQFTLPRGERQPIYNYEIYAQGFNSRSRGGSDSPTSVKFLIA